jgi:hypothetical protein
VSDQAAIRVAALAGESERPALELAARNLGEALSAAAGGARTVDIALSPAGEVPGDAAIILVSLLPEVARVAMPWAEEEARLRALCATLAESGAPVLLLTVLRHVDGDEEGADRTRLRIRRLNLLATELSRELAVSIIDIDRALADVGARRLGTDYRLGGDAIGLVAKTIALGIATDALDAVVPFEVQDKARAAIAVLKVIEAEAPASTMGQNLMTLGKGRRRQTVNAITQAVQADHVGWLVRQLARGQLGPRDAIAKVTMAIRRRGARDSFALLASGIGRMIGSRR